MTSKIILRRNEENRIKNGHQWIFSNEIASIEGNPENGDIVDFLSNSNQLLGSGFYNKHSLIAGRLLAKSGITDLADLIKKRIHFAFQLRKAVFGNREVYRLINSESDFLPGLIIDKYNDTYVLQCNSAGMQRLIPQVQSVLIEYFQAKSILSVNDARLCEMEGINPLPEILYGDPAEEIIHDGVLQFKISFSSSQKTGFFLDQMENRKYAAGFTKGAKVLDAYCNSGGFGIHALNNNAAAVDFIDISSTEMEHVQTNISLNGLHESGNYQLITGDVFDFLEKKSLEEQKYDVILIDPPTFAKNRKSIPTAIKAYQKMHRLAILCLKEGGYLCTSSCSHHIGYEDFMRTAVQAAIKLGMQLQLIHAAGAGSDHPVLPQMPETAYLKFFVFRVCKV